jgi:hypothetical protein
MRTVSLPPSGTVAAATPLRRLPSLLFCTIVGTLATTAGAQSTSTGGSAARLGFRFDARAHAAAEAVSGSDSLAAEPPPPGVVRLPRHVVIGERVPLGGDDLLTPAGKVEVAKRRHLSPLYRTTFGPLSAVLSLINNPLGGWNPNGPEAMALYEEAQRQRRSAQEADLAGIADLAEAAKKIEAGAKKPKAPGR